MRFPRLFLIAALIGAPTARADIDRLVDFLPPSAQLSVGMMIEPVSVLDALSALNLSSPAFHRVMLEQLEGFGKESGIQLDKTVDLLVAGTMTDPMASALLAHVSLDIDKLEKFLQPFKGEAKLTRVGGDLVADLGENAPRAIFRKDGVIVVAMNPGAADLLKPRAEPSALQKEMKGRGVGGAWVLIDAQFPEGLPESAPAAEGEKKAEEDPMKKLGKSFRGLFLAARPAESRLVITFDKPEPAAEGKKILDQLVDMAKKQVEEQAQKEGERAKAAGPFRYFDPEWTSARVAQESAKDVFEGLKIEAKGPELEVSLTAKGGEAEGGSLVRSSFSGLFASLMVPAFKQARAMQQFRECFKNQGQLNMALEMMASEGAPKPEVATAELFKTMQEKGLIPAIPQDPGQGDSSSANYTIKEGSFLCTVHGNVGQSIPGTEPAPGKILEEVMQKLPIGGGGEASAPEGSALPDPSQMGDPSADPEAPIQVEPAAPAEDESDEASEDAEEDEAEGDGAPDDGEESEETPKKGAGGLDEK